MNRIVLWSGGAHSTYAMYYLAGKGNPVTAVHVMEMDQKEPQLPPLKKSTGIELKLVRMTAPLTWTRLITMGLSAAHWIETRSTPIPKDIPDKDKVSRIYLGKETESEEVERFALAASPEYPVREFKHFMEEDEIKDALVSLGFPS